MKVEKIGITDASGFVGSHLSTALQGAGFKIISLGAEELIKPGPALKKFVRNSDLIIYAADIKRGEDAEIIAGGVVASLNLISAAKDAGFKNKVIFLSSIQAGSDSVYGRGKELAEKLFSNFSAKKGVPVRILRLPNMFGEGKRPFYSSVVATFCQQIQNGQKPSIDPKSKDKKISLIYINDVVGAVIREIKAKNPSVFLLKSIDAPNSISIQKLADLLLSFKDNKAPGKDKFKNDLYRTYLSYAKS